MKPTAEGPRALIFMRHCKSDWGQDGLDDFDRPLSQRGIEDARRMGRFFRETGLTPDALVASPSARTRRTVEIVARAAKCRLPIVWERSFYGTGADSYLPTLRALEGSITTPLVVGHNPALEEIVALLAGGSVRLPTGAMVLLHPGTELHPVRRWSDLAPGSCALAWLVTPRLARAFL